MRRMIPRPGVGAALALAVAACHQADLPKAAGAPAEAGAPVVMVVGTSLTAGLGLDPSEAYPALLQRKVDSAGWNYQVVNRGVSGETSSGARQRIGWLLRQPVAVLVLEVGANDGLRGLDPDSLRANLDAIIALTRSKSPPPRVLLLGMEAPPNLGPEYAARFRAAYRGAARDEGVALVPFALAGVGGVDSLNQPDGIHPTAQGQQVIADLVWKSLRPLLAPSGAT